MARSALAWSHTLVHSLREHQSFASYAFLLRDVANLDANVLAGHDDDHQHAPQRRGKMLVRAMRFRPRTELENDQRNEDRQYTTEAAKWIYTTKKCGEYRDQK